MRAVKQSWFREQQLTRQELGLLGLSNKYEWEKKQVQSMRIQKVFNTVATSVQGDVLLPVISVCNHQAPKQHIINCIRYCLTFLKGCNKDKFFVTMLGAENLFKPSYYSPTLHHCIME